MKHNWQKLLNYIYKAKSQVKWLEDQEITEESHFCKNTGLNPNEVKNSVTFLKNQNLIKTEDLLDEIPLIELTTKGFEVIHELNMKDTEKQINYNLMAFTAVLVYNGLVSNFNFSSLLSKISIYGLVPIFLLISFILLAKNQL